MKLNYKMQGQGPALIILHGLFGSLDNWQTLAKRWAEHFTVFTVDQRNHGRSPHDPDMNYQLMADDLIELMEDNFVFHAHLLGHSMGGKTVMKFALEYPDMVEKLIVADMSPMPNGGGHEEIFKALFDANVSQAQSRSEVEEALKQRIPQPDVRQFLMKSLYRTDSKTFDWRFNLDAIYEHYSDILEGIHSDNHFDRDTLFIKGSKSNYVGEEDMPLIKKLFPNAKVEAIDAGHWLHAEKPDEFYQSVLRFLTR
jgi:pimeloyl-ACP methyl ester carboxylesterase